MAKNTKRTSHDVAGLAARLLNNTSASDVQKSLAAAALAQARTSKQTGAAMESGKRAWFAMNLVPDNPGATIRLGDAVEILEREESDGPPR